MTDIDRVVVAQLGHRRDRRHEERTVIGAEAIDDAAQLVVLDAGLGEKIDIGKRATCRTSLPVHLAEGAEYLLDRDLLVGEPSKDQVSVLR